MMNRKKSWTSRELCYKLFGKKVCPQCGYKMKHHTIKKNVGLTRGPDSVIYRETYRYFDYYYCNNCKKDFSISELSNI